MSWTPPTPNAIERAIKVVSPAAALRRYKARIALEGATYLKKRSHGYDGAGVGRRSAHWRPRSTSADVEIALAGRRLRDRMRDLVRNTPHSAEAVEIWVDYLVGHGIAPRANTGDEARNDRLNGLWADWMVECDADGPDGFHALTALAVRGMVEGGDVFLRRRMRRMSDGLTVPLQLQLQEGDHLDESKNEGTSTNGRTVRGIQYDRIGRRSGYWLFRDHPGETGLIMRSLESTLVPADSVIHLFRRSRVQQRGVPWGTPVIQHMRELADWAEAELVRKKIEACTVAFVTNADAGDDGVAPILQDDDQYQGAVDGSGVPIESFEPGLIAYLHGNKDVRFNDPKPTGGVAEWNRLQDHRIAAGWGQPYELLTGDLSQVNYSSIRTGLVKFRRRVIRLQQQLVIPRLCQTVWGWFVRAAYDAGAYDEPTAAVTWSPPSFEEVDRTKEAMADLLEMRAGTLTLPQAIARKGHNPDDVIEETAAFNKKLDDLDLIFDSDPRRVSKVGVIHAAQPQADEDGEGADGGE